jgi:hypothetical protein
VSTPLDIAKSRPAETAMPIATVIAALISKLVGVEDTDTIFYIALLISFVPAAVTWTVELMRRKAVESEPVRFDPPEPEPVEVEPEAEPVQKVFDVESESVKLESVAPPPVKPAPVKPPPVAPPPVKPKPPTRRSSKRKPNAS